MALTSNIYLRRGDFTLDARVRVEAGETLALLGPNGSGKSTLLAAIAGLLVPERGSIDVNGRTLTSVGVFDEPTKDSHEVPTGDPTDHAAAHATGRAAGNAGGADRHETRRPLVVEPHERRVGLLGQDPLLFPHLSALENVAFGARARGESAADAREAAAGWLDAVGLRGFESRLPAQLSGGQQQRVAIARALAAEPDVLLLDEPMAALDVQNASAVRTLLRERLAATALPTIVVSHDVVDAMVLADRVALMDNGRIVDFGDPATVLGQPKNQFAANLVGLNLLHGTLDSDGSVRVADDRSVRGHVVEPGEHARPITEGEAVIAAFPPSALHVVVDPAAVDAAHADRAAADHEHADRAHVDPPHNDHASADHATDPDDSSDSFSWRATVGVLEPAVRGIRVPFIGETFAAELTTSELLASGVREGVVVTITVNPALVTVYRPREGADTVSQ